MILPNGTFNNENRYVFNNWSNEDFTAKWDGVEEIIPAGGILEVPEYKAFTYTKHFVDKQMNRDGKASFMGIAAERKEYEDKTCSPITAGTDSPALASIKEKMRAEIEAEMADSTIEEAPVAPGKKTKAKKNQAFEEEETI